MTTSSSPQSATTAWTASSAESWQAPSLYTTRIFLPSRGGEIAQFLGPRGVTALGGAHRRVDAVPGAGERLGGEVADAGGGAGDENSGHGISPSCGACSCRLRVDESPAVRRRRRWRTGPGR